MKNRRKSGIYIMVLLLTLSLVAVTAVINGESTTVVSMDDVEIPAGGSVSGVLKVNDVSNLGSFSVNLSWNPSVVDVVRVDDGDFIIEEYIDHNAGFVNITGYSMSGVSGNRNIASVKFKAVGSVGDSCAIEIVYSQLLTADTEPEEVDHTGQDGVVTITKGSSGDGDGDGGPPANTSNVPPVSDASASQTSGFVGVPIYFDGSLSADSDGTITSYSWDFDDSAAGNGETTTHTYSNSGTYTVTLTVADDAGATDEDTIDIIITIANNPPTKSTINGHATGNKNTPYDYIAVSTDADNDTIQYTFNWGDGSTNTVTDFLPNGTATTQTHSWTAPGAYEISVNAFDNKTESGATKYTVLIDAYWVKDIGLLIDDDSDGTYDTFYSNATEDQTDVEKQDDGTYLIDNDGDGNPDNIYDVETDTLTKYTKSTSDEGDNTIVVYALAIFVILIIVVLVYLAKRNKDKKKP